MPDGVAVPRLPHAGGMPASSRGSERSADPRAARPQQPDPGRGRTNRRSRRSRPLPRDSTSNPTGVSGWSHNNRPLNSHARTFAPCRGRTRWRPNRGFVAVLRTASVPTAINHRCPLRGRNAGASGTDAMPVRQARPGMAQQTVRHPDPSFGKARRPIPSNSRGGLQSRVRVRVGYAPSPVASRPAGHASATSPVWDRPSSRNHYAGRMPALHSMRASATGTLGPPTAMSAQTVHHPDPSFGIARRPLPSHHRPAQETCSAGRRIRAAGRASPGRDIRPGKRDASRAVT